MVGPTVFENCAIGSLLRACIMAGDRRNHRWSSEKRGERMEGAICRTPSSSGRLAIFLLLLVQRDDGH